MQIRIAFCLKNSRDGFVLVSVLWILAILTVVSLGFGRRAMLERQMAWYALDREQAQQMARGAVERALLELSNKELLDQYNEQRGYTGLDQGWANPVDLLSESTFFPMASGGEFEEDVCEYVIEDCERWISLNHAPGEFLEALDVLRFGTIDEILERRSSERRGYQAQRFHSIEELRSLQDFSEEEWYGREGESGLRDMLTIWGDPGGGRVNLNTASAAVLHSIPGVDGEVVEAIIEYRSGNDGELYTEDDQSFESIDVINEKLRVSAEKLTPIRSYCKINSRLYKITSHATRRRGKINAFCTVVVEMRGATPVVLEWKEQAIGA